MNAAVQIMITCDIDKKWHSNFCTYVMYYLDTPMIEFQQQPAGLIMVLFVCCAAIHCDKLRHLVNESCNVLRNTVESCQSYLMCIACVSRPPELHLIEPVCLRIL